MGDREMLERLYAQLEVKRKEVREAETECEELADHYVEKLCKFIAAGIAQRGDEGLRVVQEEVDSIQKDIDFLLGV